MRTYVCMLHSIFDEKFLYCEFLSEKIGFFHLGWIHFQACTIRCYVNLTVLTCIQTQICDPENDLEIVHVGMNQFCENICRFYLRKLKCLRSFICLGLTESHQILLNSFCWPNTTCEISAKNGILYTVRTRIESPLELNPHSKIEILIESSLK